MGLAIRHDRVTAAMDRALLQEAQTTSQVSEFLVDLFRVADPEAESGETVLARTLLDQGVDRLARDTRGPPEVRAQTLTVLGAVYDNLGLHDEAMVLVEDALQIRRNLYGPIHPEVAQTLATLAEYAESARKPVVALEYYDRALAAGAALGDQTLLEASVLQGMGRLLRDQGNPDSAEVLIRQALEIRRAMRGEGDLGTVLAELDLAYVLRRTGAGDSAQVLYEQAIDDLRAHGDSGAVHLSVALNNLAYLYRTRDGNAAAEVLYREALLLEERVGTVPGRLLVMNNLAAVLDEEGRADEADRVLADAIELAEVHWPSGHWRVGSAYGARGAFHLLAGDPADAEPFLRRALDIAMEILGEDNSRTAHAHRQYGVCLGRLERYREAEPHLLTAFQWFEAEGGPEQRQTRAAASSLVELYGAWGRPDQARRFGAVAGGG
jgi:serine/threonine-protein kinase